MVCCRDAAYADEAARLTFRKDLFASVDGRQESSVAVGACATNAIDVTSA